MSTLRDRLLDLRATPGVGLRWREGELDWREYVDLAADRAARIAALLDVSRPPHVGVLLENTPEMALQLAAAAYGGHVLVGLNHTRRGPALAADIARSDAQFVFTDAAHRDSLADCPVPVHDVADLASAAAPDKVPAAREVTPDSLFMLVFTSGTSGEPKAVRVTHEKVLGPGLFLADRFGLTGKDVCYISTPLFHSNAVMAGWGVALAAGATIALGERFSASGFVDEARRFGATYANYVGKPLAYVLATPERADDQDNALRIVFGNEANDLDIAEFGRRFGCQVVDGFGSTENAVIVSRVPQTPPGSLGLPVEGVAVLDPLTGTECPPASYDETGRVLNLDECTGELVNTTGTGQFAGYYNDAAATAERMRDGMYWSGDLAYRDAAGFVYYAGRTSDWLRVDGENLAAAPIERILLRHPAVSEAAVYALPDPAGGDQLVAALVLRGDLPTKTFGEFLAAQPDLGTKSWPSHVLVAESLPRTPTNKVLKRELRELPVDELTWSRTRGTSSYAER